MSDQWKPFQSVSTPNPEVAGTPKPNEVDMAKLIADSITSAMAPVLAHNQQMAQRLDAIDAQTKRPAKPEVTEPQTRISVFDDEAGAIAQYTTPLLQRQLEFEASVKFDQIKAEYSQRGYGEVLQKFGTEINSFIENSPLVGTDGKFLRGHPQYIRNVIDMIIGREASKQGLRFDGAKDRGFFIEAAGNGSEANGNGVSQPGQGMTDSQRNMFKKMGVPMEAAQKTIDKMKGSMVSETTFNYKNMNS
jgi:hypothetical protein